MAWRSTRVLVGAAVAVAVLLILIDVRGSGPTDALRGIAGAVAGPPERALAWVRTQAGERLGGSAEERARIAELEQQLAQARALAGAAAAGTLSEADTRALAALAPSKGFSRSPGAWSPSPPPRIPPVRRRSPPGRATMSARAWP